MERSIKGDFDTMLLQLVPGKKSFGLIWTWGMFAEFLDRIDPERQQVVDRSEFSLHEGSLKKMSTSRTVKHKTCIKRQHPNHKCQSVNSFRVVFANLASGPVSSRLNFQINEPGNVAQ